MDKFAAMRTFRRVVELHGFSAAARDLKLSNAAVSSHVRELEEELGVALLARTTRHVSPTEAGRAYYERCARILDDLTETELALGTLQAAPRGTLRINCPMALGVLYIAAAVADFCKRHPEVRADLVMNDRAVDMIEEGFDVSLRARMQLEDSTLIGRRLCRIRQVACAAPTYLQNYGEPVAPADLKGHRALIYSLSSIPGRWTFRQGKAAQTVELAGYFTANSSLAVREALLAGLGLTVIPESYVGPDIRAGRLKRLLEDYAIDDLTLYALYPSNRHLSPKVRAFVDFMAAHFADPPPWERVQAAADAAQR